MPFSTSFNLTSHMVVAVPNTPVSTNSHRPKILHTTTTRIPGFIVRKYACTAPGPTRAGLVRGVRASCHAASGSWP
eukprot:COSAG02_NODE_6402_length_3598_cov_12.565019_3_plen_76_part_00